LFCDGSSISTTTYATLFAVIGYMYGGSGGNFSLPNFHNGSYGVMPIGSQSIDGTGTGFGVVQDPGQVGNVESPVIYNGNTTLINDNQLAPHDHIISPPQATYTYSLSFSNTTTTGGSSSRATGSNQATFPTATNGMTNFDINQTQAQYYPPFCSVMFIIKYI
jgi:microcystin-dependent protein